jgi:phosphoribosylanthranilate isomerase
VRELPPLGAAVGVFVDTVDATVFAAARRFGLHAVQTYSNEPPDLPFFPIAHVAAFRVKSPTELDAIRRFVHDARLANRTPSAVLVDSFVEGEMGGTGHTAPWELIADSLFGVPLILAGGLTPDNVAEAIRVVKPWGVDVASGVESSPGRKDSGRVRAFVQAVRAADVDGSALSG